ncbi:hypothetical protein L195_g062223, partial [Trifolium pratense]
MSIDLKQSSKLHKQPPPFTMAALTGTQQSSKGDNQPKKVQTYEITNDGGETRTTQQRGGSLKPISSRETQN